MHIVYHIFFLLIFVVQPISGYYSNKKYLKGLAEGKKPNRVKLYNQTMLVQWCAFLVLVFTWFILDRSFSELGFKSSNSNELIIGVAVLAISVTYLLYSLYVVRKMTSDEKVQQLDTLGDLIHVLPQNNRDFKYFVAISITAGIVEEIIYRGFVFSYLAEFMPMWSVILVSSAAFGLGHAYQGIGGVIKVMVMGLVFGTYYVFTGSIWLPIIAHAVFDILQGSMLLELAQTDEIKTPSIDNSKASE